MKQFISLVVAIICVVVSQKKEKNMWLTTCQGVEVNGEVLLDRRVVVGRAVSYKPHIDEESDYIRGEILGIEDAQKFSAHAEVLQ